MTDYRESLIDILLEQAVGGRRAPDLRERILEAAVVPAPALATTAGTTITVAPIPRGRVGSKQLAQFTVQFSSLMNAGVPIVRCLKILASQQRGGALRAIVDAVREDVETGSSLSEAMARHPRVFDSLYTNMVRAGEAGGVLDVILDRLAAYLEKAQALKRQIVGAMIYPSVVMSIALAVVLGIMTWIVPHFSEVFRSLDIQMPAITLALMSISEFITSAVGFVALVVAPAAAIAFLRVWSRTRTGAYHVDRLKLAAPLLGPVFRKAVVARFCRTLGTMLQSGVPLLESLKIVRHTAGNEVVALAVDRVHDAVREGESIAAPLGASGAFDEIVVNMIDIGEETGELDRMLLKIADNYDAEVDAAVAGLVSVLEPIMIVGLGVTVGFIVVALFMPLLVILQNVG